MVRLSSRINNEQLIINRQKDRQQNIKYPAYANARPLHAIRCLIFSSTTGQFGYLINIVYLLYDLAKSHNIRWTDSSWQANFERNKNFSWINSGAFWSRLDWATDFRVISFTYDGLYKGCICLFERLPKTRVVFSYLSLNVSCKRKFAKTECRTSKK